MELTRPVAEFVAQTRLEGIDVAAAHHARWLLIDAIGCALAGHGSRECHRPAPFVLRRRASSTMTARGGTNKTGDFFRGATGVMGKQLPV